MVVNTIPRCDVMMFYTHYGGGGSCGSFLKTIKLDIEI